MAMDDTEEARKRARRLPEILENLELPDDDEHIRELYVRAREATTSLLRVADDPISIGMVGEFSKGKSLLLGTLMGKPDMLPVERRATTGNVTALHLVPDTSSAVTRVGQTSEIDYMTAEDLRECIRYVLERLADKVQETLGDVAQAEKMREYDPVAEGWGPWERWSESIIWADDQGNANLRKIDVELCRLRAASEAGQELLGTRVSVGGEQMRAALDLGEQTAAPSTRPAIRLASPLTKESVQASTRQLRESFPLIRRVHRWVHVASSIWPLGALQNEREIVLLDFPGLGSDSSGERDDFLCASELDEITTIIVAHPADTPGSRRPLEFYDMMQRRGRDKEELADCILVTATAFDLVSLPPLNGLPTSANKLIAASQELNGIKVTAHDLTGGRQDRSAIVSSVAAMGHYHFAFKDATAESRKQIDDAVLASEGRRKQWEPIVGQLLVSDAANPFTKQLTAFVDDGGLDSLRQLIERHVRDHAVRIKRNQLKTHDAAARTAVRRLYGALGDIPVDAARAQLTELITQITGALRYMRKKVGEIDSPMGVELPGEGTLLEAVSRSAVIEVFQWKEWASLAAAVRDDNRVSRSLPPNSRPGGIFKERKSSDITDTRGLIKSFESSVRKLSDEWHKRMLDWMETWAERVQEDPEVAEARQAFLAEETNDLLRASLDAAVTDDSAGETVEAMEALVRFNWVRDALEAQLSESAWAADDAGTRCPLLPDKALPWHYDVPDNPDGRINRHQSQIFRLRRELATAVSDVVTARVNRLLYDCVSAVRVNLNTLDDWIPQAGDLTRSVPEGSAAASWPQSGSSRAVLGELLDGWGEL